MPVGRWGRGRLTRLISHRPPIAQPADAIPSFALRDLRRRSEALRESPMGSRGSSLERSDPKPKDPSSRRDTSRFRLPSGANSFTALFRGALRAYRPAAEGPRSAIGPSCCLPNHST